MSLWYCGSQSVPDLSDLRALAHVGSFSNPSVDPVMFNNKQLSF